MTTALVPLAKSIASIARRLLSTAKPGISDVLALVLADGGVIAEAVRHIKEVPAEYLHLDADEGQVLSAMVKQEFGKVAETTNLDEIIGELFTLVPAAKGNIDMLKHAASYETKGEALGDLLARAGRLFDLIHPPVPNVVAEL